MKPALQARPLLLTGHTWHARHAVKKHAFRYGVYGLLLPMRSLRSKPEPLTWGGVSFNHADHGLGGSDSLAWIESVIASHAPLLDTRGEVWLQCLPRVMGYAFKPVSFWYCTNSIGAVTVVVVEVNNTFGERHVYLLTDPSDPGAHIADGRSLTASKVFHVSPFFSVAGDYQFKFKFDPSTPSTAPSTVAASVDLYRTVGATTALQIQTFWGGQATPLSTAAAWSAFWRHPLQSFGVVAKIHWQALKLWVKGVPFFSQPPAPKEFVST